MDSDGEVPPSPETITKPVVEIKSSKNNSSSVKRKKLGSVSRKSNSRRSKSDKPSTPDAVNSSAGAGSSTVDIYWDGDVDNSSANTQQTIFTDFDVYESAKILERGNVPLSEEEIRARRKAQKNFSRTQEPISARQLKEMEERAASGSSTASSVSGSRSNHPLETQMPGTNETQFTSVCHLLDEAHLLIENEFSDSPLEHTPQVNETPSVAQAILNDFKVDSDDDDMPKSPPRLFLKKPNRKYTRSAKRRWNTTAAVDTATNIADVDENDSDYGDDIDLNASFMIQKNMADLGVLFESQLLPQKVEMEFDDSVFERGSQSGDERIQLAGETSDSDDCGTADNKTITESGMLSEDDELFSNFTTPRIPSTVKRAKRSRESMVDDFARPAASTPSAMKQSSKPTALHPKRLRFDCDRNALPDVDSMPAIGFVGGFKSVRTGVGLSADKMKKSASIFDEILAEFDGLPTIDGSMNAMPGFMTASSVDVPEKDQFKPSTSKGFESARKIDPLPESSKFIGFETARSTETGATRLEDIAEPGIPSTSAGFKTARNVCFLAPSSSAMKKAAALFDFEQDDANSIFEATPKKHVKWQHSFETPAKSDAKPNERPRAAMGTSINVSNDTYDKYAALFEEEINENMFDQCEADTSASLFNISVAASPVNQSVPLKFITSTPNVVAAKLAMERNSMDNFLGGCDEFFTEFDNGPQRPQNLEPKRIHLSGGSSQPDTEGEFNPTMVSQHVKRGRKEALARQQANCLRKNKIRPQSGSLQKQKSSENRVPLKELGTPKSYSSNELTRFGVPNNVINANIDNVVKFKFEMWRYFSKDECLHNINGIELDDGIEIIMDENSCVGFDELSSGFLACSSVDPKLVPDNWIRNSLKWILLKLAGLERSFPQRYAGTALTPANVMLQLKYRYDREIDRSQRSAIRKIVEQDDAVSKPMVLFVSRIKKTMLEYALELSDGWYGIGTGTLDSVLAHAVQKGKIQVGTKLLIQDAELIGVEEACSPLEMPSSAALKFSANSTRRVKWYTRLGFCNGGRSITFPMKSIEAHGGHICKFTAFIARIYPTLFVAKTQQTANKENPNQSRTEIRSEMVQRRLDVNENRAQFEAFEAIYSQVSAEVEREYEAKRNEMAALPSREISEIDDAEELWHIMERSHDTESFESILNFSQKSKIREYQDKIIHEKNSEISNRVKEKFDKLDKSSRVTPLLKIRLVDCNQPAASRSAILSIWNADECSFDLRENSFIEITSVSANGIRGKDLLLTANGRSKIRNIDAQSMTDVHISIRRKCYQLADICESAFSPNFDEFDVVGYVLHVGPIAETKFQTVYFVDSQRRILHVKCWNGIKQYALDGVIKEGTILAIANLEWRTINSKSSSGWPQAFVNERTTFSANPKSQVMIDRLRRLSNCFTEMVDVTAYIEECMSLIHERRDSGNSSAHSATILSDFNLSPMNRTLNHSKNESASKSRAKKKIERLKVYKSPPRTPAMNVSRGSISTLRRQFKSPMPTLIPNKTANNQENET